LIKSAGGKGVSRTELRGGTEGGLGGREGKPERGRGVCSWQADVLSSFTRPACILLGVEISSRNPR